MLSAVGRLEHSSFTVGPIGVTENAHVDHIRIALINDDPADLSRIVQSNILPSLAPVA